MTNRGTSGEISTRAVEGLCLHLVQKGHPDLQLKDLKRNDKQRLIRVVYSLLAEHAHPLVSMTG